MEPSEEGIVVSITSFRSFTPASNFAHSPSSFFETSAHVWAEPPAGMSEKLMEKASSAAQSNTVSLFIGHLRRACDLT